MIKTITSKENSHIKNVVTLKNSKCREEQQKFVIEGKKCLEMALSSNLVKEIFTLEPLLFVPNNIDQYVVNEDLMKKIAISKNPEGVLALCDMPKWEDPKLEKVIYLDQVNDPGNMGTIIRTALAFNYDAVVISDNCVSPFNEKVVAAAKGSLFKIPVIKKPLEKYVPNQKIIVSALKENAININEYNKPDSFILVVGNEAHGVSEDSLLKGDDVVIIPISNIDSLNVSVAAGILMEKLR